MTTELSISADDFRRMYACPPGAFPEAVTRRLDMTETRYRSLSPDERDALLLTILKRHDAGLAARNRDANIAAFSKGWREHLDLCRAAGVSWETLTPRYVREHPAIRLGKDYALPRDPLLYDHLQTVAMLYTAYRYLNDVDSIYEFGCGTGRFLYLLATEFAPSKAYVGTDWTEASQELLAYVRESTGLPINGVRFDMLLPSRDFVLRPNSGVFTVHALEQLGDNYEPFLNYLLENRPAVVVHHEPVVEFYDESTLFDYLAATYHRRRGYLEGYLPALRRLEAEGRVEIVAALRPYHGPPYQESTCLIVWRPR
jgi:SAM-dependent methyltransferase